MNENKDGLLNNTNNNDNNLNYSFDFAGQVENKPETAPVNPEPSENTVVNETNNVVEEIPQTGTSIWTYLVIIVAIACVIYGGNLIIKKQK